MDVEFLRYRFEDRCDGGVASQRFRIGVRHLQILYMIVCTTIMGIIRGSTCVGVLAMTDATRLNDTYIQVFNWNRQTQGTIVSSYFFGYTLMLMPAELLTKHIGGKLLMTIVLTLNGSLCVLMPTMAKTGGWIAVCNSQFLLGMSQACISPASKLLLRKWLPPHERKRFSPLVYNGLFVGTFIGIVTSGLISKAHLGWELVYYSQGTLLLSMGIMWGTLTANSPNEHQAIGEAEKEYIVENLEWRPQKKQIRPWQELLKSHPFWAISAAHAASNALYTFYLTNIPVYLQGLGMSFEKSTLWSAVPLTSTWMIYMTTAPTVNWMCRVGDQDFNVRVTRFRKIINGLGAFGIVLDLAVLSNSESISSGFAVVMLVVIMGLLGFQFCGFLDNIHDVAENFGDTFMVLCSTCASAVGAAVPLIVGFIFSSDATAAQHWTFTCTFLILVYMVLNIVYTALASGRTPACHFRQTRTYQHCTTDECSLDRNNSNKNNVVQ